MIVKKIHLCCAQDLRPLAAFPEPSLAMQYWIGEYAGEEIEFYTMPNDDTFVTVLVNNGCVGRIYVVDLISNNKLAIAIQIFTELFTKIGKDFRMNMEDGSFSFYFGSAEQKILSPEIRLSPNGEWTINALDSEK